MCPVNQYFQCRKNLICPKQTVRSTHPHLPIHDLPSTSAMTHKENLEDATYILINTHFEEREIHVVAVH